MLDSVVGSLVTAFGFLAPSPTQVLAADPNDAKMQQQLRVGEGLAVGASLAAVMFLASKSNSNKPYLYWLLGAGGLIIMYEYFHQSKPQDNCNCEE